MGGSRRSPKMVCILDTYRDNVEGIIEEKQAQRAKVAALSQMQLQALQWVDHQEKEAVKTKCTAGRVSGDLSIFAGEVPPRESTSSTQEH